jgi:antitoxin MazE
MLDQWGDLVYIQCRYREGGSELPRVEFMRTKIQKWGNSLGLRIPKALAEQISVEEGASVEITVSRGGLLIRPAGKRYSLKDLLEGVNPSNRHDEVSTGERVGREVW